MVSESSINQTSVKKARRRLPASRARGRRYTRVVHSGRVGKKAGGVKRGKNGNARTQADREALAAISLEKKKQEMRGAIANMTEEKIREMLLKTIEKDPVLIQEVMDCTSTATPQPGGSDPGPSDNADEDWCTCSFCREMPTRQESICCGKQPNSCLSRLARFQLLVLDEDVLDVAQLYRQDVLAVPAEDDRNRGRRHAAYRQFTLWQHGRLGAGNRRAIPSCCVLHIRAKFPDRFGQYTGFIPGRLG